MSLVPAIAIAAEWHHKTEGELKLPLFLIPDGMKHFVYIIYSETFQRYYTGESVNPAERLKQHYSGFYESSSTCSISDWKLIWKLEFR